jgi:adenine-specific DNA-methyltransferase
MPIIDFHGKKAITNFEPPFHILEEVPSLNYQSPVAGNSQDNILIEGDNLLALKSLLPEYEGKIKCIYIDPPYNTNNKDWVYCDNIEITSKNDPAWKQVEKFLKDGNEVDYNDQSRHSKWLCMMYPRLKLLHKLLKEDGVIFVSIDENEYHHLKMIMDEIWGEQNFVEQIIWNKRIPKNDKNIGNIHEYILLYTKNPEKQIFKMAKDGLNEVFEFVSQLKKNKIDISEAEKQVKQLYSKKGYDRGITLYNNLDENYELWGKINVSWPNAKDGPRYDVMHPILNIPMKVPENGWRFKEETFDQLIKTDNLIKRYDGSFVSGKVWFAKDEKTQPSTINYLKDLDFLLLRSVISIKSDGSSQLNELFGFSPFDNPKPVNLIKILIDSICTKDDIILDSFAGSGTTAQSILEINKRDNSGKKFISIQLHEDIKEKTSNNKTSVAYKEGFRKIHEITRERIVRVAGGYSNTKGEAVEGLGGGFKYYRIGTPLFIKKGGDIVSTVTWEQLAPYIYFTEFKSPVVDKVINDKPKISTKDKTELYLLYKEPNQNTLTEDLILQLNQKSKAKKIVYADKLELGLDVDFLNENGIVFKQIPYDILSI